MIKSLMVGLNEKDMQAEINSYNLNDFYFPTIFPLKKTYSLDWKTLKTTVGLHIAADLVARGSSLDAKTRNVLKRIEGSIPKIAIERKKDEEELNEYDIMVAMTSGDNDLRQLVEAWAEDTNYCWNGVAARIEWMALYQMSHGGKIRVTSENNAHVVSEYNADYDIPSDQKVGTSIAWSNASTAKPLSVDFRAVIKASRSSSKGGIRLKYAWMNTETFNQFVETAEVQKACASYAANALNIQQIPDLNAVNAALAKIPYLYGLQVIVVDQDVTVEFMDGTQTSGNPFTSNVVLFTESNVLGKTYFKEPIDMKIQGTAAIKVLNGPTCVKKFANEEPVEEITQAVANAFPGWSGSERSYHLDTKNSTWNEGE